ncbi:hypothetical protein [Sphingomonas sp.]|uniref:hypothetical protein n=1 Tax=Sphingomonas sp. TaxID=28214 RepID=UPI00286B203C|nr:hypothetical protein [Sphingomonas sp.]
MKFDVLNLVITSVVSLVLGILISRHFASRRKIAWTLRRRKVLDPVGGKFPTNVKMFFDNHEVLGLSEWKFGLWNSGNRAITKEEITTAGKLTVNFKNDNLLKTTEPSQSREGMITSIDIVSQSVIEIIPELLDVGDAIAFTIYTTHDNAISTKIRDEVSVEGHVLNMPRGLRFVGYSRFDRTNSVILLLGLVFYGVSGAFLLGGGLRGWGNPTGDDAYRYLVTIFLSDIAWLLTMALAAALIVLGALMIFGGLALVVVFITDWFNQPPKFIQRNLSPTDDVKGLRTSIRNFFRFTYG